MSGHPEGHALSLTRPMVFVGEKRLVGVRDLRGRGAQTATEIFKVKKYLKTREPGVAQVNFSNEYTFMGNCNTFI